MARIYQRRGPGPFPTLLDVHGGAWHDKDRLANVAMCEAAAKSGVLVVETNRAGMVRKNKRGGKHCRPGV